MVNFLRPHVGNFTATRGSCILTMQRYYILIAVYECFPEKVDIKNGGHDGHLVICQNRFWKCQNQPLYIKYLYFIYSEQMTESENHFDHFDLDHFDQKLVGSVLHFLL